MQTIITKYLAYTNYKPARISAQSTNGKRICTSDLTGVANVDHARAAMQVGRAMGWTGKMIGGHLKGGKMVWVFVDDYSPSIVLQ